MTRPTAQNPVPVPAAVAARGDAAAHLFRHFLTGRTANTREAYGRALARFFRWCAAQHVSDIAQLETRHITAWIADHPGSPATVRQHLAAVRTLFGAFVSAGVLPYSPASAVRGPRAESSHSRAAVLNPAEVMALIDQLPLHRDSGLRDRALIAVLLFAFARISAALAMDIEDYVIDDAGTRFRLGNTDNRLHSVPAHPLAAAFVEPYLARLHERSRTAPGTPLFRTVDRRRNLTTRRLTRNDALYMLRRRARAARLNVPVTPHTLRATGLALFRANGGDLETARRLAGHADARSLQRYGQSPDPITPHEIVRIRF